MELRAYLKQNKIRRADFAKKIGIELTYLHNICQHTEQIGRKTAIKIVKATHGEVAFSDLWDD